MSAEEWSLEGLIEAIRGRTPEGSPLDRLREATGLSERLSALADEVVGHFVEEARGAGHSWAEIGEQLGVTKQAAQQKFVAGSKARKRAGSEGILFDRFTDRSRRVLLLAQDEARRLNHNYLGTEHILLGLIAEGKGIAAQALTRKGIRLDQVRAEVEEAIGTGSAPPEGPPPFTPRSKKVIELSFREALQLGHNYIGTEHLLLGLIREGEGVAAQVLEKLGADFGELRAEVLRILSGGGQAGAS